MKYPQISTAIAMVIGFFVLLGYMLYLGPSQEKVVLMMVGALIPAFTLVMTSIWDSGIVSRVAQDEANATRAAAEVVKAVSDSPITPKAMDKIVAKLATTDGSPISADIAEAILTSDPKVQHKAELKRATDAYIDNPTQANADAVKAIMLRKP